jgi:hypothetical protein
MDHIKGTIFGLGAKDIEHWDARWKSITRKNTGKNEMRAIFNKLS